MTLNENEARDNMQSSNQTNFGGHQNSFHVNQQEAYHPHTDEVSMYGEDEVEDLIATFESENKKYRQQVVKLTQEKDRLAKNYSELERNAAEEIRAKDEELKRTMKDLKSLKQRNSESVAEEIKLQADNKILRGTIKELHDSIKRISMGARDAVEAATEQSAAMAQEIQSLKKNFIMAKQYKLHTALEHVSKNSMKEQQRLQRIIAHMQAEKIALQALLQQAEDDRDTSSMRLQLAKEENDRIMHGANARVNDSFVSPDPAESHSYDHINSNNNQLQISVIPEPANGLLHFGPGEGNVESSKVEEKNTTTDPKSVGYNVETDEALQGVAQYEGISSKNMQNLAANTAALNPDEVITNINNFHADDNTDHKKQMRAMEQELLQSLSIDTAAPTFEAIELLDENGNTPSANLKAVLTAMKKSHENLNSLSVNVPPSPITPSQDEPVDVKMDVSSSETLKATSVLQSLHTPDSAETNQDRDSPSFSLEVVEPPDEPIAGPIAAEPVVAEPVPTEEKKKDTNVQNNLKKKKRNLWTKVKIGVALSKPRRKPPPPPPPPPATETGV